MDESKRLAEDAVTFEQISADAVTAAKISQGATTPRFGAERHTPHRYRAAVGISQWRFARLRTRIALWLAPWLAPSYAEQDPLYVERDGLRR